MKKAYSLIPKLFGALMGDQKAGIFDKDSRSNLEVAPETLTLSFLRQWAQTHRPVFVVGFERSGTSPLYRALRLHPSFCPCQGETFAFIDCAGLLQLKKNTQKYLGDRGTAAFRSFAKQNIASFSLVEEWCHLPDRREFLQLAFFFMAFQHHPGERLVEKTPAHRNKTDHIFRVFPKAQILFCKRNPVDIIASHRRRLAAHVQHGVPQNDPSLKWLKKDVRQLCREIAHSFDQADSYCRNHPDRYRIVEYERLTSDPKEALTALCGFLGEDFSKAMLRGGKDKDLNYWDPLIYQPIQPKTSCAEKHLPAEELTYIRKKFQTPRDHRAGTLSKRTFSEDELFCPIPFRKARIAEAEFFVHPCCAAWIRSDFTRVKESSIVEMGSLRAAWNSSKTQEFRRSILDGSFRYCKSDVCPSLKKKNGLPTKDTIEDHFLKQVIENEMTIMPPPSIVALNYDFSCNLYCPQCRPKKHIATGELLERLRQGHDILMGELDRPEELIVTGTGDALASPIYRDFLADFDATRFKDVKIDLRTNVVLLDERMWKRIEPAHKNIFRIVVSLDAATGDTYSKVRRGGNFSRVSQNMAFLGELRKNGVLPKLRVEFCVQKRNYQEMGNFVEMCRQWNVDVVAYAPLREGGELQGDVLKEHTVHSPEHPLHKDFITALDDSRLRDPIVSLAGPLEVLLKNPTFEGKR